MRFLHVLRTAVGVHEPDCGEYRSAPASGDVHRSGCLSSCGADFWIPCAMVRQRSCARRPGRGAVVTVFDLLVIALFFAAIGTLILAAVLALRGRWARALRLLRRLALCTLSYVGIVYAATALSKEVVLRMGDPQ